MSLVVLLQLTSCNDVLLNDFKNDDPISVFESCWQFYDRQYPYFELKNIDWDQVYDSYRPRISAETKNQQLAEILSEMLRELKDYHVYLEGDENINFTSLSYTLVRQESYKLDQPFEAFNTFPEFREIDNITAIYESSLNNIAYVELFGFDNTNQNFTQLLNAIQNRKGLIIDIRNNSGGSSSAMEEIAANFTNDKIMYAQERYRINSNRNDFTKWYPLFIDGTSKRFFDKPVVLIISQATGSAAERFASIMKEFPQVTLIGDTTFGGSGGILEYALPNGWVCTSSFKQVLRENGQYIESFGITPDITNVFDKDNPDSFDGEDKAILKAVELIETSNKNAL
ncbi:S41 family peptidase [Polaribacter sp. R77954]|uniref:S41 family peptidase n=1 Tax=Polaribacter sp. R77954 TaxID=3093870 RepID=UPI0037C5F3C3